MSCTVLLLWFYASAWMAVRAQSATIDEPLHAMGAYLHVFDRDFRVNPEDPPLWNYLAMLPHHAGKLLRDPDAERRQIEAPQSINGFMIATRRLFQTPGNDGAAFINHSRAMMLVVGVLLGAAAATWAWQCGGATAAMIVSALIVFDPNLLAHAPLVKNDVSLSLVMFCLAWVTWNLGRRARWRTLLMAVALCAAATVVKFSGLLVAAIFFALLLLRAAVPASWVFLGHELSSRRLRALAAMGVILTSLAASFLTIWACYGFRFAPTQLDEQLLDTSAETRLLKQARFYLANGHRWPDGAQTDALPTPVTARVITFAEQLRLLPQAWLYGLLFTYRTTLVRETFLLGEYGTTGWWYYFPLAMLFKTPIATLAALVSCAAVLPWLRRHAAPGDERGPRLWTALCIGVPLLMYGSSALTTNLNLGVRHVLPLYPFLFLFAGIVGAKLRCVRPRAFAVTSAVLLLGLMIESLAAFPHYLSFFNAPSRPYRLRLLSDSNFDWGQDLTYLAAWQRQNPREKLYLGYWGTADPAFYGIRYSNLPGGFVLNPEYEWPPQEPGVIAISATLLQGVNCPPSCRVFYAPLRHATPRQVVGGTIYLYNWPPR